MDRVAKLREHGRAYVKIGFKIVSEGNPLLGKECFRHAALLNLQAFEAETESIK